MNGLRTILAASLRSALLGGLVGGVVVAKVMGTTAAANADAPVASIQKQPPRNYDAREPSEVEERVSELEGRLAGLERQRKSTEALKKYAQSLAEADAKEPGQKEKAPMAGVVDAEDPSFELAVRTVLDRADWEKDEEERLTRAKRRDERAQRQTALLVERLSLSAPQAEVVARVLIAQMERFRALRGDGDGTNSEAQRPATRSEWGERIATIRKQTENELREVLDEGQLTEYRAFADEEGIGPQRWDRGGNREGRE